MPELHLQQPELGKYAACGPFTKNGQKIQRFLETRDTNYIYKNGLDKAFFQQDMAYEDFKDLKKKNTIR